jgi:hypothetical protein
MSCMYYNADPALLFSSLNKWDLAMRRKLTRFGQITKCVLGAKLLYPFWCLHPRHWFPCTTFGHSLSRPPGACVYCSRRQKSPTFQSIQRDYAHGDHSPQAQASHGGLERPSELQPDSSKCSIHTIGYDPRVIPPFAIFSQPSRTPFTTCCRGQPVSSN